MYCPKCGQENLDNAQSCHSCSSVLTSTPIQAPTLSVKKSRMAIAALILGILSIFTLSLTAIPAIILGIISLVIIEKSGGRITGRGFAITGIVVPVVAVPLSLMIMLIPALNRVKKQARTVACMANLKQWGLICAMYTEENDGYFFSGEGGDNGRWWIEPLQPYHHKNKVLLLCPAAVTLYSEGGRNPFGAWEVDDTSGNYGMNGWVCNPQQGKLELRGYGPIENYWRTPNVKGAEYIPFFSDSMWCEGWPRQNDKPPPDEDWLIDKVSESEMKIDDNEMRRFCVNRHEGFTNSLFMDWSVRKVGLKELWKLKWNRTYDTEGPWTMAGKVQPSDWPQWMRNFRDY
ncbi:MAG: DUF4190 domain-containing protein [Planctomycetes bacterium]|nr:DUF4190 domain-containing protein [Planctomycetota bacterium]